ncbi:MAG: amino acid ABC transporter permease [Micrococcales bacterium]|nr:amino acid ABC transporter permease [Micrococcales bacterium]
MILAAEAGTRGFFPQVWYILTEYGSWFLKGAGITMMIAVLGTIVGTVIGLMVGTVRTIPTGKHDGSRPRRVLLRVVNALLAVYIEVFRGTPMLIQALVVFFGLKAVFDLDLAPIPTGLLVVSINTGAYMSEIVRGGIQAIDPGQMEAGRAVGMKHWPIMRGVILPQAIRNIMPATGNEFVINIKDTSVLFLIGVTELFTQGKSLLGITYRPFEVYLTIAAIYLVLTYSTTRILRVLERRLEGPDNFTLATSQTMPESVLLRRHPDGGGGR